MELLEQLQSALGSSYAIERELGGGGMSRVFAATETALGRKVVIKVVPSELGAGVNTDRFKREILLAANLQHPHIVPVLTAGEMDGVPYYTMPFVEGESLRARVTHGPLPIADAVSILRDVSKALSYAHERGIVHRDIKPDNVVLTGGSAAVIDFGIAKAISAARATESGGTLTQLGMSVGTPIYMAPEQAAADPSADHRADIYSFGCMAYELLSGHPPFSGFSPQRLLAAHMGERPKPISEVRPDTPPLLAELVMRCMEKDPAARPQSAAEIGRTLDAVASSASGEAIPMITSGGAAAIGGPGALRRALTVYALAFVAVVVVAKAAVVGIGLPDWVTPASIVLMALGLPLILATALGASRHLSWKRTAAVGVYGIAGFIALIGLSMTLRAAGVGPFASLLGSGKLRDRDRILVADFTASGDSTLGPVVSEAVRADLGQSPIVSVVTPQTVAAALQRMQRPVTTRIDTAVARELAVREGIKAIVAGNVHALAGGGFLVTMRLVSADSGQELASLSESAGDGKELIPTIGKLTHQLRGKMGESLRHLQSSPGLAQVTTSSLAALEKYSAGSRAMNTEANLDKAIPLFREAVTIDTAFASAYRALAIALSNSGRDREGQIRYIEKAYAHSDRLPEVERYLAAAAYYTQGPKPDIAKARAEYEALLTIRPTQFAALNNAGLLYARDRQFVQAEEYLKRAVAANPSGLVSYGNLMTYQAELGKVAAVDSTFAAEMKVSGNNPRIALQRTNMLWMRGEYDSVNVLADSIAKAYPREEDLQLQKLGIEASTAMGRGKLSDALRLDSQFALMAAKRGSPQAILGAAFDSAMVEGWFRGSHDKALARLKAGLERTPMASLPPLSRPYEGLAQSYALAGRPDLARAVLADYEKTSGTFDSLQFASSRHGILSSIALAEHRYLDAAHEARAADYGACTTCILPIVATAYDLGGQPDSAIAVFTKYVSSTSIQSRVGTDRFFLAGSYKRLGELWEAKGDKDKAAGYYGKFVALWKDADPDMQPKVAEVKRKLAKISGPEARP